MGLQITWSNDCEKIGWSRGNMEYNIPPSAKMSMLPEDYLQPASGETSMTMTVFGQDVVNMGEIYCVWYTQIGPGNYYWFAINLLQPANVAHLGWSPIWKIANGTVTDPTKIPQLQMDYWFAPGQNLWRTPVSEPGMPYIFNAANDKVPMHIKIKCDPVAGGEDLQVTVTISDIGEHPDQ